MLCCLALSGCPEIAMVHLQGQTFFNSSAHISFLTHTFICKAKDRCLYRSVVTGVEQDTGSVTEHAPPCQPDSPSIQLDVPARSTSSFFRAKLSSKSEGDSPTNTWPPLKCLSQVMVNSIGGMAAFSINSQIQWLTGRGPFRKTAPYEHLKLSYQSLTEKEPWLKLCRWA